MKKLLLIFAALLFSSHLISQINPREYDENYMMTVFEDNFDGTSINRNIWESEIIHRGIGQLIDSSLTHNVVNSNL